MTRRMITEHALLRYIERVAGVDLDALTEAILTSDVRSAIKMQARTFKALVVDNAKLICRQNNDVLTAEKSGADNAVDNALIAASPINQPCHLTFFGHRDPSYSQPLKGSVFLSGWDESTARRAQ